MIKSKNVKKLKPVFTIKDEFKAQREYLDEKFATKEDINAGFKSVSEDIRTVIDMVGDINQKLKETIEKFDKKSVEHDEMLENHERRLDRVEDKIFPTI
jgi:hypothetical protein